MKSGKFSKQVTISELYKENKMEQVLTLSDVFAVGYGDLGSSIYYALGITTFFALGAAPIALAIAGFVFACTALTYAEMSAMTRVAGGSSTYTKYAINDLVSFIAGWALLLDFVVTIAISSYSVAPYLSYFFPILKHTEAKILFTICLITFLFTLNFFGSKHSTKFSWILTILTLTTQLAIVVIGLVFLVHPVTFIEHLKIGIANSKWSPSWHDFWKGTAMAMVAYTGIEAMAQLSAEAKRPSKTVPRAIILAMTVLITMYFLVSIVALSAVTPQELSTTYLEDPIAGIVQALPIGSELLAPWIGLLGAIILVVAANAGMMGASRLALRMGENYQLPRVFFTVHKKYKSPWFSMAVFGTFAALIVVWGRGRLDFLADLYNFGAMLAFFFAHLSLIILRIRSPNQKRPFKIPLNIPLGKGRKVPISALIGVVATFATWILVIISKPEGRYLGFSWVGVGLVCYIIYRKRKRISPSAQVKIERVKIPDYNQIDIQNILVPTRGGESTETVQLACELAKMHNAKLTAVNIIEVPFSLSFNTPMHEKTLTAEQSLKRAEAIAREFDVPLDCQIIRARSVPTAIKNIATEGSYDLVVLGAFKTGPMRKGLGQVTQEIINNVGCRVIVACN